MTDATVDLVRGAVTRLRLGPVSCYLLGPEECHASAPPVRHSFACCELALRVPPESLPAALPIDRTGRGPWAQQPAPVAKGSFTDRAVPAPMQPRLVGIETAGPMPPCCEPLWAAEGVSSLEGIEGQGRVPTVPTVPCKPWSNTHVSTEVSSAPAGLASSLHAQTSVPEGAVSGGPALQAQALPRQTQACRARSTQAPASVLYLNVFARKPSDPTAVGPWALLLSPGRGPEPRSKLGGLFLLAERVAERIAGSADGRGPLAEQLAPTVAGLLAEVGVAPTAHAELVYRSEALAVLRLTVPKAPAPPALARLWRAEASRAAVDGASARAPSPSGLWRRRGLACLRGLPGLGGRGPPPVARALRRVLPQALAQRLSEQGLDTSVVAREEAAQAFFFFRARCASSTP